MAQKRSEERIKVMFEIELKKIPGLAKGKTSAAGEIVNLSRHGACIITDAAPGRHDTFEFNILIPQEIKRIINCDTAIHVRASIRWRHDKPKPGKASKYGVKFTEQDLDDTPIKKIIDYENAKLTNKDWNCPHPDTPFTSVPVSSQMLEGMKPSAISVDVTNLCNLNCKHCFWDAYQRQVDQKTNPDILDSVRLALQRFPSITNILWYGGEPLLNAETRNIIKNGIKLLKNNLIVTNGTHPLPVFRKNVHYTVSIDGTEKVHNFLRGRDIYNTVKRNILDATKKDLPVGLLYCINAYNMNVIPDFLKEWEKLDLIGIAFTVYTPMLNKHTFLTQNNEQKYRMVQILRDMKIKYRDLIVNTDKMIELLNPEYGEELVKECPMNLFNKKSRVYCLHLCNDGTIRIPCSLGRDASHVDCRSITKIALYAGTIMKDRDSYRSLLRMYLSNYHDREKKLAG